MTELLAICILTGVGPMAQYTFVIWLIDHWEREPLPLVLAAFFWGAIPAVILAIVGSTLMSIALTSHLAFSGQDLVWASYVITAPITEEIAKGLALLGVFLFFRHELDSLLDGVLYGSVIGFGFAGVENVMYFLGAQDAIDLTALVVMRAVLFGLNHAFFTSLTGIGFVAARFASRPVLRFVAPVTGLALAMLCHAAHNHMVGAGLNGLVFSALFHWSGVFWVFVIVVWSLLHQGRLIREHLGEEVALGIITQPQAIAAGSLWSRIGVSRLFGGVAGSRRRQLHQLCGKLALKKHLLQKVPHDEGALQSVLELRSQIASLSQQLATTAPRVAESKTV